MRGRAYITWSSTTTPRALEPPKLRGPLFVISFSLSTLDPADAGYPLSKHTARAMRLSTAVFAAPCYLILV